MNLFEQYFPVVKRIFPKQNVRPEVGLDIGLNSCKMIEVKRKEKSFEVLSWAIEPIENGDLRRAIKKIINNLTVPNHSLSTAIGGKGTLIRNISMPQMTLQDLKKSFTFEADKYFPFPKEHIYTDCYILNPKARNNKIPVLIAAAKKELIDERIKLLTGLGLQANFVGLNSIAIANVLSVLGIKKDKEKRSEEGEKGPQSIAVLDMGEVVSNVTVFVDNIPLFNRDIFVGGSDFTKCISNAMGLSLEEAEQLKCLPEKNLTAILDTSDSAIVNLISELRLSFDYFITEMNVPITQLSLTGGASMLEGLTDVFSKNLEISVEKWNPLESIELAPGITADEINRNAGKLGVALGLALSQ